MPHVGRAAEVLDQLVVLVKFRAGLNWYDMNLEHSLYVSFESVIGQLMQN